MITWIAAVVFTIGASILHVDTFMMASAEILVVSSIALCNRFNICYQEIMVV